MECKHNEQRPFLLRIFQKKSVTSLLKISMKYLAPYNIKSIKYRLKLKLYNLYLTLDHVQLDNLYKLVENRFLHLLF